MSDDTAQAATDDVAQPTLVDLQNVNAELAQLLGSEQLVEKAAPLCRRRSKERDEFIEHMKGSSTLSIEEHRDSCDRVHVMEVATFLALCSTEVAGRAPSYVATKVTDAPKVLQPAIRGGAGTETHPVGKRDTSSRHVVVQPETRSQAGGLLWLPCICGKRVA